MKSVLVLVLACINFVTGQVNAADAEFERNFQRNLASRIVRVTDDLKSALSAGEKELARLWLIIDEKERIAAVKALFGRKSTAGQPAMNSLELFRAIVEGFVAVEEHVDKKFPAPLRMKTDERIEKFKQDYTSCVLRVLGDIIKDADRDLRLAAGRLGRANASIVDEVVKAVTAPLAIRVSRPCPISLGKMAAGELVPLNVSWGPKCTDQDVVRKDKSKSIEPYHPSAGALLFNDGLVGQKTICSGTLIAPNLMLTAAHCICHAGARDPSGRFYRSYASCHAGIYSRRGEIRSALDPRDLEVFFQHAGSVDVKRVIIHPNYSWVDDAPRADIAVLILKSPIAGVSPAKLDTVRTIRYGQASRIAGSAVGFGAHNPLNRFGQIANYSEIVRDAGLKLVAPILPSECNFVERARKLICWDYKVKQRGFSTATTCHGDSGGPLFMADGGQSYLAGVTTAGDRTCLPGGRAYDIEVYPFSYWLTRVIRIHGTAVAATLQNPRQLGCRYCPFCGNSPRIVDREDGSDVANVPLFANPEFDKVSVPDGARFLRVSVNCTANGRPLGVQLKDAKGGTKVCARPTVSSVASCLVSVKAKETWQIAVDGHRSQDCQIVVTSFD